MNTLEYIIDKFKLSPKAKSPIILPIGRDDLAVLFKELGFITGAEIGIWKGEYSEVLCKANPSLILYSIDPWNSNNFYETQSDGDAIYETAKYRLAPYRCLMIRDYSLEAVQKFPDCSIDFVYIDGNHDFQNCTNDICAWSKKVREGGIVSGHDYGWWYRRGIHVYQVVNAYAYAYKIKPWFVLGEKITKDKKIQSWMWIKE